MQSYKIADAKAADGVDGDPESELDAPAQLAAMQKKEAEALHLLLQRFTRSMLEDILIGQKHLDEIAFQKAEEVHASRTSLLVWGLIKRFSMLGVFLYFFTLCFNQSYYNQKFLALDPTAGNCNSVAKLWTTKVNADKNGEWQGSIAYQPNLAIYQFTLFSFGETDVGFIAWMKTVEEAISKVGALSATQELTRNLILWSSWVYTSVTYEGSATGSGSTQLVWLTGDAQYIMNNEGLAGTVGGLGGDCSLFFSSQSYNLAGATFSTNIDMTSVQTNPSCYGPSGAFPSKSLPNRLGWDPTVSGNTLSVSINVHALFTALAVSYQVNGPSTLNRFLRIANISSAKWFYDGQDYTLADIYDQNYPGMAPISCVGPTSAGPEKWNCFLRIGDSYGIPFLQHKGANSTFPQKCLCSDGTGKSEACNKLNLMFGVVVYDHTRHNPSAYDSATNAVATATTAGAIFYGGITGITLTGTLLIGGSLSSANTYDIKVYSVSGVLLNPNTPLSASACSSVVPFTCNVTSSAFAAGSVMVATPTAPTTPPTSSKLLITRTTSGTVSNEMVLTISSNVTTVASGCYMVATGIGTCEMSDSLAVALNTTITGAHKTPTVAVDFKTEYEKMPAKFKPIMPLLEVFYITPPISAKEASERSFEAAFSSIFGQDCSSGDSCSQKEYFKDLGRRRDWYSYSNTWHYGTGTIISFNSYSNLQTFITSDNVNLVDGSCNDVISTPNFDKLAKTAFGRLIEDYYECTMECELLLPLEVPSVFLSHPSLPPTLPQWKMPS